jgi:hypothetical protein
MNDETAVIVRLWHEGQSGPEIARTVGLSEGALRARIMRLRRAGVDLPRQRGLPAPVGRRFSRWLVLGEAPKRDQVRRWQCQCDCGTVADVIASDIRTGRSSGCAACKQKDGTQQPFYRGALWRHSLYGTWSGDSRGSSPTWEKSLTPHLLSTASITMARTRPRIAGGQPAASSSRTRGPPSGSALAHGDRRKRDRCGRRGW